MLIADITYSPDDGGYYATVWNSETGKNVETLPQDGVLETRTGITNLVRAKHESAKIRLH